MWKHHKNSNFQVIYKITWYYSSILSKDREKLRDWTMLE